MEILIASLKHIKYCNVISQNIASSAKVRGTGIALRSPEYIQTKIENNNAIIVGDKHIQLISMVNRYSVRNNEANVAY